ncbi:unnamed protein product [Allacma fusca]|uniref:Uncharacterized protein n=1 Tax=Allacma fusca TaxID=39272 RepID=A0A8J2KNB5_9HEXA|nr:unnamed protein product [Allacma fusca]
MEFQSIFVISVMALNFGAAKGQKDDPMLISNILETYESCLIRLVSFTPLILFDYSKLSQPVQILNYPLKHKLIEGDLNVLAHRTLGNDSMSMKCFVFILLSDWQGFDELYVHGNPFVNMGGYGMQNLELLMEVSSVLKPHFYFLYWDDPTFFRDIKFRTFGGKYRNVPQAARLISPIFLLQYTKIGKRGNTMYFVKEGWFFCPFCRIPSEGEGSSLEDSIGIITEFNCSISPNCMTTLLTTYEITVLNPQNFQWLFVAHDELHIAERIKTFVFYEFVNNETISKDILTTSIFPCERCPVFTITSEVILQDNADARHLYSAVLKSNEFLPLGTKNLFNFVTSEGVREVKTTFEIFLTPFEWRVWAGVSLSASITVLLCIGITICFGVGSCMTTSLEILFWIYACLVEKEMIDFPFKVREEDKMSVGRSLKILIFVWLLAGTILTNGYKGILKSNFALPFPFETNYTELRQLQNFTWYLPLESCPSFPEFDEWYTYERRIYMQNTNMYRKNMKLTNLNLKLYDDWIASYMVYKIMAEEKYQQKAEYLYDRIYNTFYYCKNDTEYIIRTYLNESMTALVTSSTTLNSYWQNFRKYMQISKLKFSHNGRVKTDGLTSISGVYITTGMDHYHNWAAHRMKTLLQNGILWLWDREERERLGAGPDETYLLLEDSAIAKPLSFTDSDVHLIFYIYFVALTICIGGLVGEVFVKGKFCSGIFLPYYESFCGILKAGLLFSWVYSVSICNNINSKAVSNLRVFKRKTFGSVALA